MENRETAKQSPWNYFIIAIAFSWLFWIPATFVNKNILESPWVILLYVGGVGPAVAGILLTYLNKDEQTRREYWQRVIDVKRMGRVWYLLVLFAYPLLTVIITMVTSGQVLLTETGQELLAQPLHFIPAAVFIFLFGPFPEELGWRGYALDGLQKRMNAVWASLLLGAIWAIWHVPLFLMNGTYQNELGFGSAAFWRFMSFATVISVFFTWIYNNNRRSILSAALFHFSVNFTGNVLDISGRAEFYRIVVLGAMAVIVVAIYGAGNLTKTI